MANLTETSRWEAGIYQFETSDPVMGGPNGIDNRPTRELANRTLWLKNEIAKAVQSIGTNKTAAEQAIALKANIATMLTAGAGLTGGGTLAANLSFALATPSTLNGSTTNWAGNGATGHTHELAKATPTLAGVVKLVNTLDVSATDAALTAAMGKKLQDEKLGNSGNQTINNGTLTVGKTRDWAAIKILSGAGVWEIETNPNSSSAVDGSISMGFKFVEPGQPNKGIIMPVLKEGYENVAYQSWVRENMVALAGSQTVAGAKTFSDALTAGRAEYWDKYRMPVKNGGQWIIETDPDSDLEREASLRINFKYEQGRQSRYIHFPAPEGGNQSVAYRSWVNGLLGGYVAAGSAVMIEGNQTVNGVKTFSGRADFSQGLRISGSNTEQYSGFFRGTADWYWSNPISGQSLQLKDNGDLAYQNRKIYHEGNKPAWNDIQSKPDVATRGTTLAHYGITDGVNRADFDWAKVPSGTVAYCAGAQPPHGWLAANGAQVSRSTFPDLFRAIGTHYGAGNGSTTFHLPDLRGEFVRGWDNGRNADAGRTLGSFQGQSMQDHFHGVGYVPPGEDNIELINRDWNSGAGGSARHVYGESNREVHTPNLRSGNIGTGNAVGHIGETRPRNIALLAVIKA